MSHLEGQHAPAVRPRSSGERNGAPRIVRIIGRLNIGGPAIHAILASEMLEQFGYKTILVSGSLAAGESGLHDLAKARNIDMVDLPVLSREVSLLRDLRALAKLVSLLLRERPLIVHTHTAKAGTLGRVAAFLTGVPIRVHTFHGHVFSGYFSSRRTRVFLAIERLLARVTHCIVTVSPTQQKDLALRYRIAPIEKIACIPLGFEVASFLEAPKSAGTLHRMLGLSEAHPLIGWIGRLVPIKDPFLFLESAKRIVARHPQTHFVFVGDGELRSAAQAKARELGLTQAVHFMGWQRDLPAIYADLNAVLLTSVSEGTPLALLECMACSKTFVATRVGGIPDLMVGESRAEKGLEVFDNGILTGRDPARLAEGVCQLLESPQRAAAMGAAGREFVIRSFAKERMVKDLADLYCRLEQSIRHGNRKHRSAEVLRSATGRNAPVVGVIRNEGQE